MKGTSRRLPTTYRRLCVSLAGWDRRHQRRWVNARLRHPDTRDLPSGLLSEDKVFWKEFMVASCHGRIKERRMFSASALTYTSFFNRPMSPPLTTVQSRGSRRPAPRIPGRAARGWPSRLQGRSGSGQLLRASNAFFPSHRSYSKSADLPTTSDMRTIASRPLASVRRRSSPKTKWTGCCFPWSIAMLEAYR